MLFGGIASIGQQNPGLPLSFTVAARSTKKPCFHLGIIYNVAKAYPSLLAYFLPVQMRTQTEASP